MNELLSNIESAKRILVPSGRAGEVCMRSLQESYPSIQIPNFGVRALIAEAGEKRFIKVRQQDILPLLEKNLADIGILGSDICEESPLIPGTRLSYMRIGKAICSLQLLLPLDTREKLIYQLANNKEPPVKILTKYPRWVGGMLYPKIILNDTDAFYLPVGKWIYKGELFEELNMEINTAIFKPTGSLEAYVGWLADGIVDIVETGETASANGLGPVIKLADIFPSIVFKRT